MINRDIYHRYIGVLRPAPAGVGRRKEGGDARARGHTPHTYTLTKVWTNPKSLETEHLAFPTGEHCPFSLTFSGKHTPAPSQREMRTPPQQWLHEGVHFKPSDVLCPARQADGEMSASNAGEHRDAKLRGRRRRGSSSASAGSRGRGAVGRRGRRAEGVPLSAERRRRVGGTEAASSSCEILARPEQRGGREAR